MSETEAELIQLRAENTALKALLAQHGIAAPQPSNSDIGPVGDSALQPNANELSPNAKVNIFRRLFRGREDIYLVRWISKTTGKPGYSPLCANKWRPGICKLPTIKGSECSHSLYAPVTDYIIRQHSGSDPIAVRGQQSKRTYRRRRDQCLEKRAEGAVADQKDGTP